MAPGLGYLREGCVDWKSNPANLYSTQYSVVNSEWPRKSTDQGRLSVDGPKLPGLAHQALLESFKIRIGNSDQIGISEYSGQRRQEEEHNSVQHITSRSLSITPQAVNKGRSLGSPGSPLILNNVSSALEALRLDYFLLVLPGSVHHKIRCRLYALFGVFHA